MCSLPVWQGETKSWRDNYTEAMPNIQGKVIWSPSQKGWAVTYINKKGTRGTSFKGLNVPTLLANGQPVSAKTYETLKWHKYLQAIQLYNQIDCSGSDRIQQPESSARGSGGQ